MRYSSPLIHCSVLARSSSGRVACFRKLASPVVNVIYVARMLLPLAARTSLANFDRLLRPAAVLSGTTGKVAATNLWCSRLGGPRSRPMPAPQTIKLANYRLEGLVFPKSRVSSGLSCVALRFSR
jgi:hypothetical protein